MKHSKKYLVCAFMVGASFVACCIQPMTAKGIEISYDDQAGIQDYLQAGKQGLLNIDFQLDEDEDGNRSTRLQIQGLQNLTFNEQFRVYDNMDFSLAPSSISISGTSYSGVCYLDGVLHPASIYNCSGKSGVIASSDFFTISYSFDNPDDVVSAVTSFPGYLSVNHDSTVYIQMRSNFFASNDIRFGGSAISGINYGYSSRYIPSFSSANPVTLTQNFVVCGEAQEINLPPGDYDSTKPWEYYNDTLLPYMRQNFNITNIEDYFVFPNGYSPDPSHTTAPVSTTIPIIYPTAPVFDQGLDESGTQPTGIESINYELPQLETKTVGIPAFDLTSLNPNQVMQPLSNGLAGLWALVTDLLNTFELFPLVSLALLVGVIGGLLLLGR